MSEQQGRNLYLRVALTADYYPRAASARFEVRWYRNDDFTIHYQEEHPDSVWKCRWDRHPNSHNSRDHVHPPPAASRTNAEDAQWPPDYREGCRLVLGRVEARIETLWEQKWVGPQITQELQNSLNRNEQSRRVHYTA